MKRIWGLTLSLGIALAALTGCSTGSKTAPTNTSDSALRAATVKQLDKAETIWKETAIVTASRPAKGATPELSTNPPKAQPLALVGHNGDVYDGKKWQPLTTKQALAALKKADQDAFSIKALNQALAKAEAKITLKSHDDLVIGQDQNGVVHGLVTKGSNLYALLLGVSSNQYAPLLVYTSADLDAPAKHLRSNSIYGTWQATGSESTLLVTDNTIYTKTPTTISRDSVQSLSAIDAAKLYGNPTFMSRLQQTLQQNVAMPRATTLAAAGNDKVYVFLSATKLAMIDAGGTRTDFTKTDTTIALTAWPTGAKKAFDALDKQAKTPVAERLTAIGTNYTATMVKSLNGLTDADAGQVVGTKSVQFWITGKYDAETRVTITDQ